MTQYQVYSKIHRCFHTMVLFIVLIFLSISVQGQNKTSSNVENNTPKASKIDSKVPSHLPLKIEFEKVDADDLLQSVQVKITNKSNKPIYFLLFDIVPTDVLDPQGVKYSFPISYGRQQLRQPSEQAQSDDIPILPGESHTFMIDEKLLAGWAKKREKLKLHLPKLFDLRFQRLNYGDGSGYFGRTGKPFTGRYPKDSKSGKETKNVLMPQSQLKAKGINIHAKQTQYKPDIPLINLKKTSKTCRSSNSYGVAASFFAASNWVNGFVSNLFTASAATFDCDCGSDFYCKFREETEIGCCPYDANGEPQANTFIPSWESASCDDPNGFCSEPERSASPFLCAGSNGQDYSCYGTYLVACGDTGGCGSSEICGNGLDDDCDGFIDNGCPTGGGSGGGYICTPYYWVYYESWDNGETWEIVGISYAGCW